VLDLQAHTVITGIATSESICRAQRNPVDISAKVLQPINGCWPLGGMRHPLLLRLHDLTNRNTDDARRQVTECCLDLDTVAILFANGWLLYLHVPTN